jgi:SAM-dependent methyltransferase
MPAYTYAMRASAIFRIPTAREYYSKARFLFLTRTRGLRTDKDMSKIEKSHYPKGAFESYVSIAERINFLVSAVATARRVKNSDKILSLGPRFESELFGYRALGYKKNQIFALDTYTYSKLIATGNMHSMEYQDGTFDLVVGGWILAYSDDPILAMREIFRVTKVGGLAVLSWDLPVELDNYSQHVEELFLPSVQNKKTPMTEIISDFTRHSFFVGHVSWSSERRIVLVVLQKPAIK